MDHVHGKPDMSKHVDQRVVRSDVFRFAHVSIANVEA
jgi:hypothetical protein